MASKLDLSQDDIKNILSIIEQLQFNMENAKVIIPIYNKLYASLEQPELPAENQAEPATKQEKVDVTKPKA